MENDTAEAGEVNIKGAQLSSMRKMPEVPDMSGKLVTPRRADPFVLSDWGGSNAYKGGVKP